MSTKKSTVLPSKILLKGGGLPSASGEVEEYQEFPLLILPRIVLFPGHSLSISSLDGLRRDDLHLAQKGLLKIGVVTGLNDAKEDISSKNVSPFGTEAVITGVIKMSDGTFGAVLKGIRRFVVGRVTKKKTGFVGHVTIPKEDQAPNTPQFLASVKAMKNLILKILKLNPAISQETTAFLFATDDPAVMCDLITPYMSITSKEKLLVLGNFDLRSRVKLVIKHLAREVELLQMSTRIQEEVRYDLQDSLKKTFLKEQMAAIKRELGEIDGELDEIEEMRKYFETTPVPKAVKAVVSKEIDRLGMMHPGSPEYMVAWNYLGWVKDLPWSEPVKSESAKKPDISAAERILNRSHFGLNKVKERILEYIAVIQHRGSIRGQVLLLVGPPGVGKTSLVSALARALDRPFVRVSLGGVKDEAEIRGHRKTYIGSLPGKIIQAIKESKSTRPVMLLDEIDKAGSSLGTGYPSDLSSALLEVLDQEQNKNFVDHYLSFPFDLSSVLFVATANSLHSIPAPLLDRMEVIELGGYTDREKLRIAKSYLIPSVCKDLSIGKEHMDLSDELLFEVIHRYTREAGVRQLRRELMTIGRKRVRSLVSKGKPYKVSKAEMLADITPDNLYRFLGLPHFIDEPNDKLLPPGVAVGLAYTPMGGDILYIESRKSFYGEGRSQLTLTGSLGTVMKESAQTVMSFLISRSEVLGLNRDDLGKTAVHLHLPDGATPKDGPSAGVAILCALTGLFLDKSVPASFAMTGEITLRGQVLPVGGIKEKLLAAHRYGKRDIILPAKNWLDLDDLPSEVVKDLNLYPIRHMFEALLITGLVSSDLVKTPKAVKYSKHHKAKLKFRNEEFDQPDIVLI